MTLRNTSALKSTLLVISFFLSLLSGQPLAALQSGDVPVDPSMQALSAEDSTTAMRYYLEGMRRMKVREYDSSKYYFQKAEKIYEQHDSWRSLVSAKVFRAMVFRSANSYDSAQEVYEEALKIGLMKLDKHDSLLAKVQLGLGAMYLTKGAFVKALEQFESAVAIRRVILGDEHVKVGELIYNIAYVRNRMSDHLAAIDMLEETYSIFIKALGPEDPKNARVLDELAITYVRTGNYRKAIEYFEQALEIRQKTLEATDPDMAASYNNLGIIWFDNGQYQKSLGYYKNALRIYLQNFSEKHPRTATCLHNIGNGYRESGDPDTALEYYNRSLQSRRSIFGEVHMDVAESYAGLGKLWYDKLNFEKAMGFYQKAYEIRQKLLPAGHPAIAVIHTNLGNTLMKMGDFASAKQHFLDSRAILEKFQTSGKSLSLVNAQLNLGICEFNEGDTTKAIALFQDALIAGSTVSSLDAPYGNPLLEEILNPQQVLDVLYAKSNVLKSYGGSAVKETDHLDQLKAALSTEKLSIELIDKIRREFMEIGDLNSFMNEQASQYIETIELCRELNDITGDNNYLSYAFEIAERSRAFYLSQRLKETNSQILPDSLLDQENDLLVEIAYFEKKIQSGDTLADSLKNMVFSRKRQLEKLVTSYETDYPAYFDLKYSNNTIDLDEIQRKMPIDGLLVEYVWADSLLYTFTVGSDLIDLSVTEVDSAFKSDLKEYASLNSDYDRALQRGKSYEEVSLYNSLSNRLYNRLLSKQLDLIKNKSLILVPDGPLAKLSFASLNVSNSLEAEASFSDLPYLVKDVAIRYGFSASILFSEYARPGNVKKDFVGFAPVYSNEGFDQNLVTRAVNTMKRDGLNPLMYNQREVEKIAAITDGDFFLAEDATVNQFKIQAANYNIIHLAAHAILSDSLPEYSGIAFTAVKDSLEDSYLESYELSNLELSADLAVLSACQTAFGPWQNGEGLISLARSFKLAGIGNVVASQWPIDDENTARIMELFYLKLKSDAAKDVALQQAQVEFLESSLYSHPAFWASHTLWGDDRPIVWKSEIKRNSIIAIGALLILIITITLFRKKRSLNNTDG